MVARVTYDLIGVVLDESDLPQGEHDQPNKSIRK